MTLAKVKSACSGAADLSNAERRAVYSDLEELVLDGKAGSEEEVKELRTSLRLKRVPRHRSVWDLLWLLDFVTRFVGVPLAFTCAGIFAALPLLVLTFVENNIFTLYVTDEVGRSVELSVAIRRWIVGCILCISGLVMEVQGLDEHFFAHDKLLVCFQHNSSADPLIVARSCPTKHFCFGKKELFLMPFMGWFGLAIGGISVDRENRDRSIAALNIATKATESSDGKCCICIAPEGTRSKTGNLLDFKKGPFHTWQALNVPVVPMVSYGNYDLYPTGSWVNTPGKIVVRYLKPILPSEANSRDEMSELVRRRMLEALREAPSDLGRPLAWAERLKSIFTLLSLFAFVISAAHVLLRLMGDMPTKTAWYYLAAFVLGVTIFLHCYNVYIATFLDRMAREEAKATNKKTK